MKQDPIITSLMDIDFYKFTMGQVVFKKYRGTKVKYALIDRGNRRLASVIDKDKLKEQLDHVRTLKFTRSDIHYLRGTNEYADRMFSEDYLEFLSQLQLPEYDLVRLSDDNFMLEFSGTWEETMYWETIAMSIINELYFAAQLNNLNKLEVACTASEGFIKLKAKLDLLEPYITFSEFGTRRRLGKQWQGEMLAAIIAVCPNNLVGTSNTKYANDFGIMPVGTCAHEEDMGVAGILYDDLERSHDVALNDWWDVYGEGLSIALTDTYTSDYFFKSFGEKRARDWKGLRHDSGDPFIFGENAIKFYESYGIDTRKKLIIFSDGLNVNTILKLYNRFNKRIKTTFGWGTDLTNDAGFVPLSIVVKMIESNGNSVVKLSDDISKASGTKKAIEKYKKVFCKNSIHKTV